MLVVADDSQNSSLNPGLYRLEESITKPKLALEGDILINPIEGVLLGRLETVHEKNRRYEAVVVIDGKITIISRYTDASSPESYLQIGTGENEVLDQLNKSFVKLPPILNHSDIVVMKTDIEGGYLISMKGLMEDGYTFFFKIGLSKSSDKKIFFEQRPILLDNRFYNNYELNSRQINGAFVSDRLIRYLSFPEPENTKRILNHKKLIATTYESFENKWDGRSDIPRIDLKSFKTTGLPPLQISLGTNLLQVVDIEKNKAEIVTKMNLKAPLKTAWVDFQAENDAPYVRTVGDLEAEVFFAEKVLHFYYNGQVAEISSVYPELPLDLSVFYLSSSGSNIYLILSQKFEKSESTSLIEISLPVDSSVGKLQYLKSIKISPYFYTKEELGFRHVDKKYYDYFTESNKEHDRVIWEQDLDYTKALLDLSETINQGSITKKYIKPIEEIEMTSALTYQVFQEEGVSNENRVSGVYSAGNYLVQQGQLVEFNLSDEKHMFISKKAQIFDPALEKLSDKEATIFFVDKSFRAGQKTVEVIVHIPGVGKAYYKVGELHGIKDAKLHSVSLVLPQAEGSKTAYLLLAAEVPDSQKAEVLSYKFDIDATENVAYPKRFEILNFLEKSIESRVRFEKSGAPYLLEDSQASARNIKLIDLSDPETKIFPNRSQYKHLSFTGVSSGSDASAWENPWLITNPNHDESFAFLKKSSSDKYKSQLFEKFLQQLEDIAKGKTPEKHHIFVVPDALQTYLFNSILANWKDSKGFLSMSNRKLLFNVINGSTVTNQNALMDLYRTLDKEKTKGNSSIILGQWSEIHSMGRLKADQGDNSFELSYVSDDFSEEESERDVIGKEESETHVVSKKPHSLYLMATEGERIALQDFSQAKTTSKTSLVILATEAEINEFKAEAFEAEYGLIEHFEIHNLPRPSLEHQSKLFERLFEEKADLKLLRYKFDAKNISSNDPVLQKNWDDLSFDEKEHVKKMMFNYYVQRINAVADANGIAPVMALTNIVNEFYRQLISNSDLRNERTITTVLIERILSEKYGTPLNLETLPENDPLKIVSSHRFLDLIFKSNHDADIEIIEQIKKTRLGQTKKDPALLVPSSIILIGPTGTGKTSLWLAIQKAVDNKIYNFNKDNNSDARAFFINLEKVVPDYGASVKSSERGSSLTTSDILRHLDNFLTGPNGARGDILFDDVSKAHPKVLGKVLAKLYEILDAEDGIYYAKRDGQVVEVPVGNLNITLTLNPTDKESKLSEYKKSPQDMTIQELIVATLNSEEFSFDKSHLARISRIIEIDKFSENAKLPGMIRDLKASIESDFTSQNRLSLFTNDFVSTIVDYFSDLDARTFKSRAVQTAMEITQNINGPLKILAPSKEQKMEMLQRRAQLGGKVDIDNFMQDYTQVLKLGESQEANFRLLQVMIDSYRVMIFDQLYKKTLLKFSGTGDQFTQEIGQQILLALGEHLAEKSQIPLSAVRLDPSFYGLKHSDDIENFYRLLSSIDGQKNRSVDFYPSPDFFKTQDRDDLSVMIGEKKRTSDNTEAEVFRGLSAKLSPHLQALLEKIIYQNASSSSDLNEWLELIDEESERRLALNNTAEELRLLSDVVFQELSLMVRSLMKVDSDSRKSYSIYEQTRIFLFVMDKAIAGLNWDKYLSFKLAVLEQFSTNMVVGSRASVQEYLFKNRFSLLWPRAHSSLLNLMENSELIKNMNINFDQKNSSRSSQFYNKCRFSAVPKQGGQ